jgi:ParB family chromosome partitioning protein
MSKGKLGRGLESVAETPGGGDNEEIRNVPVDRIDANPEQPRAVFDEEALAGLEASIARDGVLQPIVVREKGDRYELVMGERRLRATMNAGRRLIPAVVRGVEDPGMLELSLVENIQREDLNAMEKARAYRRMVDKLSLTQEDASKRLGVARATVANFMRLLDLPEEIQDLVSRGTLQMGHARAILGIKNSTKQLQIAQQVVSKDLSVRQTELLVSPKPKQVKKRAVDAEMRALEDKLREALGTKVRIEGTAKKGKVIAEYFSGDDLERILEVILK